MATPEYGEIWLDGVAFPLAAPVNMASQDRLAAKITDGDYSLDSNDLLSAWVISDTTGGHGVADLREGVDDNRCRFSTVYTRFPRQYTLPFATYPDLSDSYPLGDMYYSGVSDYEYYSLRTASTIYRNGVTTGLTITGAPTDTAVAYRGAGGTKLLYIPQGSNGYSTYNRNAGTRQNNLGDLMKSFVLWDDKLIAIDVNGQLYYATSAAATTTWTSYGVGGKLDEDFIPYKLHVYYNKAGEAAIHVITDQRVFIFDAATPRLSPIPNLGGVHKRFGYASAVWRENLYVAAGMDLLEYNGNVVRNIGLSRDTGLPWLHQGYIVALIGGQNALYAVVAAGGIDAAGDLPSGIIDVHEWTEYGWHCVSSQNSGIGTPYRAVAISRAQLVYRLYFATGTSCFYLGLPETFSNPREAIENSSGFAFGYNPGSVQSYSYAFESGRFDANMQGYQKIANAVEVHVRTLSATQTVVIKYRTDANTSYTTLGTVTTTGFTTLQFGTLTADNIYPGIPFESIEFKMELNGATADHGTTQVVESLVFSFLKVMNPALAWPIQLDLTAPYRGNSPDALLTKLTALRTSTVFFAMNHRDDTYRVRISAVQGVENTGKEFRGTVTASIVEIPSKLGAPT